jgi:Asp-tRNA(Asn)/Glu-tRNA(Gln) amidotransferase A subunit family amidase
MQAARVLYRDWRDGAAPPRRPVLGIPVGPYLESASGQSLTHFRSVCGSLAQDGYELREVAAMPDFAEIRLRHNLILAAEAAKVHAAWFKEYEELYAPRTAELIRRGQGVSESELADALKQCTGLRAGLQSLMESQQIDLWISPSTLDTAPKGLESTGDPLMNLPWTQAGLPTLNLPAGTAEDGLPLGLQVTGRWSQDEALLAWAEGLERILDQR